MPSSEDYRQMANRSAQLAIGCSAPGVAQALLALGLEYMALAARLSEPAAMRQDPAGFGDLLASRKRWLEACRCWRLSSRPRRSTNAGLPQFCGNASYCNR